MTQPQQNPNPKQEHHWSGWPGAYCLHCGCEDPIEIAMVDDTYCPFEQAWAEDAYNKLQNECKGINPKCPQCKSSNQ